MDFLLQHVEWIFGISIVFVVWLVRLEGQTKKALEIGMENRDNVRRLEDSQDDFKDSVLGKLSHIEISLSKIEGKLEPRGDIPGRS